MKINLTDRKAIVTGSTAGIGRASASVIVKRTSGTSSAPSVSSPSHCLDQPADVSVGVDRDEVDGAEKQVTSVHSKCGGPIVGKTGAMRPSSKQKLPTSRSAPMAAFRRS